MIGLPTDPYLLALLGVLVFVGYGALVHNWPKLKAKLPSISKELDRENADLDNFVKNAHANIDKKIADLQVQKQKIADAAGTVKKLVQ